MKIPKINGLRYLSDRVFIVEKPPTKRTIVVATIENKLHISFPYQIYFGKFDRRSVQSYKLEEFYLFFRDSKLKSFSDKLYLPYLPNIYYTGCVCLGDAKKIFRSTKSLIDKTISNFWQTRFNYTYRSSLDTYKGKVIPLQIPCKLVPSQTSEKLYDLFLFLDLGIDRPYFHDIGKFNE